MTRSDIVVIGAGIAGLTAARELARAGAKVVLAEARDRIGGRIFTYHDEQLAVPIELGAEFIHGKPPALWELIKEASLATWELAGRDKCFENGRLSPCAFEDQFDFLEDLKNYAGPDISFAEYLRRRGASPEQAWESAYVEGFNAADQTIIGVASLAKQQKAEDSIDGTRIFRIQDGYDRLAHFLLDSFLASGGVLLTNARVEKVLWERRQTKVICRSPGGALLEDITAGAAVITVPLGVLQTRGIEFDPVPDEAMFHIGRLAVGNVYRISMVFHDAFWNQEQQEPLSFLFSRETLPPTWWTPSPNRAPVLTGWIGGPKADDPNIGDETFLIDMSLDTLSQVFAIKRKDVQKQLVKVYTHDWFRDPFACGAYCYVPAGAVDASDHLAQPVLNTLFFAGEHTDVSGHWGTVHGAQSSGLRAAKDVISYL